MKEKLSCQAKPNKCLFMPLSICVFILSLLLPGSGCGNNEKQYFKSGQTLQKQAVSVDKVFNALNEFEELFTSRIKTAASEIDQLSNEPKVLKMTILWRTRSIAALHNILEQPEPMAALVDCWVLCIRQSDYFENGQGSTLFGPGQDIAIETSKQLETRIEDIARQMLSEQVFEETEKNVRSFALSNPIQSGFAKTLIYATETKQGQTGPFETVLNIPLAPFRALEGVDQTPMAIYDFANATRRLTDVLEELPESSRWQMLMLLYELEETNMARSLLDSLDKIAQSSGRISDTMENLPQMFAEIDQQQENVQKTLEQIGTTTKQLNEFLSRTEQTAEAFSATAKDVNQAAAAWANAATATETAIKTMQPKGKPDKEPRPDLKETAEAITKAANQIQQISEQMPAHIEQISSQVNSISTSVMIKIAFLIFLTFVMLLGYRLITHKLIRGKSE